MQEPIFQTKILFEKVAVYPNRVVYKSGVFGKEKVIMINQIAGIEKGMSGVQRVIIETTGGEKIKVTVRLKDKDALCDAIYEAMDNKK